MSSPYPLFICIGGTPMLENCDNFEHYLGISWHTIDRLKPPSPFHISWIHNRNWWFSNGINEISKMLLVGLLSAIAWCLQRLVSHIFWFIYLQAKSGSCIWQHVWSMLKKIQNRRAFKRRYKSLLESMSWSIWIFPVTVMVGYETNKPIWNSVIDIWYDFCLGCEIWGCAISVFMDRFSYLFGFFIMK